MDSGDRPMPPEEIDADIRAFLTALGDEDVETIRAVEAYADDLATWVEGRSKQAEDGETTAATATASDDASGDRPETVPEDATMSVTEIGGTEYYYYQWREGDTIRSETVTR